MIASSLAVFCELTLPRTTENAIHNQKIKQSMFKNLKKKNNLAGKWEVFSDAGGGDRKTGTRTHQRQAKIQNNL